MSKIVDRIFETVLTADDSVAKEELGSFRFGDGKIYKYVQFTDSITAAIGGPVLMNGTSSYQVTMDLDGGAGVGAVVGVAIATNSPAYYGWIQTYGVATAKVTDVLTAGDHLVAATTDNFWSIGATDFTSASAVAVTAHKSGAIALETTVTNTDATITAFVRCM